MPNLRRKGNGQPIRNAMQAARLSGPALSARTKQADTTGRGISPATVAKLAGEGKTAHDPARLRTAWLMAAALRQPLQDLFDLPGVSTVTDERAIPDGDDHAR